MVFYRKRRYARRPRKRVARKRRMYKMRIKRNPGKQVVHRHFRWTTLEQRIDLTVPAAAAGTGNYGILGYGTAFTLSNLVNFSELTQLYDQYKIARVYLRFNYNSNPGASTLGTPDAGLGLEMLICNDYDDVNTPTYNELAQRSTTKRYRLTNNKPTRTWKLRPRVLNEVYRSSLTTHYNPMSAPFLDATAADVPHLGTKWVLLNSMPSDVGVSVDVGMVVYCKGTR